MANGRRKGSSIPPMRASSPLLRSPPLSSTEKQMMSKMEDLKEEMENMERRMMKELMEKMGNMGRNMMERVDESLERMENQLVKLTGPESHSPTSLAHISSEVCEIPNKVINGLRQHLPQGNVDRLEERLDELERKCDAIYLGVYYENKPVASSALKLTQQFHILQQTCTDMPGSETVTTGIGQILEVLVEKLLPAMNQLRADSEPENSWQVTVVGQLQQLTEISQELGRSVSELHETFNQKSSREKWLNAQLKKVKDQLAITHTEAVPVDSQRHQMLVKGVQDKLDQKVEELKSIQDKLDQKEEELKRLQEGNRLLENRLQEKVTELSRAHGGSGQGTPHMHRRASASEEMWIQQGGGEHDGLIQEVEDLLTDTEGTLGRLEDHLGFYDAQVLLSTIVQVAYYKSQSVAINYAMTKLLSLFCKQGSSREMEYISRAYGMLMYAVGVRSGDVNPDVIQFITDEVRGELARTNVLFHSLQSKLQPPELTAALTSIVSLAWKLVTQPNPVIVCQPQEGYNKQIMDKEMLHWDDSLTDFELVYARPVVYRSYHGTLESKGAVGNKNKGTETPVDGADEDL